MVLASKGIKKVDLQKAIDVFSFIPVEMWNCKEVGNE